MFGIGMQELVIILLVALVVIGPKKLPEVARSLAKGMRELRRASDDLKATVMVDLDEEAYRPPRYNQPRELPERTGTAIKKAEPSVTDAEVSAADDDPETPSPPIAGSAAFGAEGTVSRGDDLHTAPPEAEGPDPMDADDHSGMPYAPGSPEMEELIAQAKARKAAVEGIAEEPEPP